MALYKVQQDLWELIFVFFPSWCLASAPILAFQATMKHVFGKIVSCIKRPESAQVPCTLLRSHPPNELTPGDTKTEA
jgi:hypothetical protein